MSEAAAEGVLAPEKTIEGGSPELTSESVVASLKALLEGEPEKPNEPQSGQELPPGEGTEGQETEPKPDEGQAPPSVEDEEEHGRTEWPESAQKRVDGLTAERGKLRDTNRQLQTEKADLEKQLNEAEAKLKEQPTAAPTPRADDPLAFITSPKGLSEFVTKAKANLRSIEDFLDGTMEEGQSEAFTNFAKANGAWDEGENAVNPGRLKQLRRLAQDALQEHAPKRLQFLQQEADLSQKADAEFPWLKDRKSEQYGLFQKVVEGLPEVRRLPDWKAICAIYVLGLQHVAKATAAKANGGKPPVRAGAGTPARQPQPRLPGAAAAVPQRPAPGAEGNIVALREKAMKSGKTRDFVDLIKAQLDAA